MHPRRAAVMAASVTLIVALLQVPSAMQPKHAAAEGAPPVAVTEAQATALAKKTGKPVPVASMQNETRDVVANGDGTFTLTEHLRPVRTRNKGLGRHPMESMELGRRADRLLFLPRRDSAGAADGDVGRLSGRR